jgi:hypothetical protein
MNATVAALPNTRMLTIPRDNPQTRALMLVWLAETQVAAPGFVPRRVIAHVLAGFAAESLTGDALWKAWGDYVDAIRDQDDAKHGRITWADLDVVPGTATEPASVITRQNAAACLALLVHGGNRGNRND